MSTRVALMRALITYTLGGYNERIPVTGNGQQGGMGIRGDAMQRAAEAWHLRVLGKTWTEIAHQVGYANDANVIRAVRRFVGRLPEPSPEETRTVWRARMEHLWGIAVRDADAGRPGALRAGVAIADRASRFDGLDAPQRVELSPGSEVLDAMVAEMMRRSGRPEIVDAEVIDLEYVPDPAEDPSDDEDDKDNE
jgi:AraC-like DNA-binding protein